MDIPITIVIGIEFRMISCKFLEFFFFSREVLDEPNIPESFGFGIRICILKSSLPFTVYFTSCGTNPVITFPNYKIANTKFQQSRIIHDDVVKLQANVCEKVSTTLSLIHQLPYSTHFFHLFHHIAGLTLFKIFNIKR